MPDAFDLLIRDFGRLSATATVGAHDPENAQKLAWQEFGTATPRPTLSATTDRLAASLGRAIDARIKGVIDTKRTMTGETILREVGAMLAEEVRDAIDGNTPPPLAASTLAARRRRGNFSVRSLVDTGKMRLAVGVEAAPGVKMWEPGDA